MNFSVILNNNIHKSLVIHLHKNIKVINKNIKIFSTLNINKKFNLLKNKLPF